jgi:glycogen phosphorylase
MLSSLNSELSLSASASSPRIAYFSMEIAMDPAIPTYSGGLGMLAGDTLRSAADMELPMVAVTLLHRRGYFHQHLSPDGQQSESPIVWSPEELLQPLGPVAAITVQNRLVMVRAWRYDVVGVTGHIVPVYLLDTDVDPNDPWDRRLTDQLYGGDSYYRLCQEAVLGLGGIRILEELGYQIEVHHMNEGHAALLTLGLLEQDTAGRPLNHASDSELEAVRQRCIFTTHTPVPAGHDKFGLDFTYQVLGTDRTELLQRLGACPDGVLNMTLLALRLSRFCNAVAMQHGRVSREMFPGYNIANITNGVHAGTWASPATSKWLDVELPSWRTDNFYIHNVIGLATEGLVAAHRESKAALIEEVAQRTSVTLNPDIFTIGFARRVATYKRADMLFQDPLRIAQIAQRHGGLQILFAGKSHPADEGGKQLIRNIYEAAHKLNSANIHIIYLENYDWQLGGLLTAGVDLWLNTPRRPYEASGTSGMKAALNGVPSLSTMDGWWVEGCVEGVTGWCIDEVEDENAEAASLYQHLDEAILPLYHQPKKWAHVMRSTLALNGSFFNTHRMLGQYAVDAYFPTTRVRVEAPHPVLS